MVSTAAEVTSAIRDFGSGFDAHRRTLGSSMRQAIPVTSVSEWSRPRLPRELQVPPTVVLTWITSALRASTALLASERVAREPKTGRVAGDFIVVAKSATHC